MAPVTFTLLALLSDDHSAFLQAIHNLPNTERPLWFGRTHYWVHEPTISTSALLGTKPRVQQWDYILLTNTPLPESILSHTERLWSITASNRPESPASPTANTSPLPPGWSSTDTSALDAASSAPDLGASLGLTSRPFNSSAPSPLKHFVRSFSSHHSGPIAVFNLLSYFPSGGRDKYFQYVTAFQESVGSSFGGEPTVLGFAMEDHEDWEDAALIGYPSIWHLAAMLDSEEYQDADKRFKTGALRDHPLLCCTENHGPPANNKQASEQAVHQIFMSRSTSPSLDREILDAAERATSDYRLCPHRIWSIARNHPDNERALPSLFPPDDRSLADVFRGASTQDDTTTHSGCTFDFCEQSQLNFTSVEQRHESPSCKLRPCRRLKGLFPVAELDEAAGRGAATAWQLSGQKTVFRSQNYLALSHVWADGTGAGTWPAGEVNACLFHFFAYVARHYRCDGIWWDAICIPEERTARAKAIVNMHLNYSNAKLTLVHDCFLRGMEYQRDDPETACIAILMSPWFSRGWTAVELANSENVVVAFKGSPSQPTLVDLDEIVAKPTTARHQVAANAILALRNRTVTDLDRLLGILGSRSTSWVKDMPIISALLVGAEVKPHQAAQDKETVSNIFQQDIYRNVITKIRRIGHGHLFHNFPTLFKGTSWCPARLLDLPSNYTNRTLTTDVHGNLIGSWIVVHIANVPPHSFSFNNAHPLVKARIRLSLGDPCSHRFLFEPDHDQSDRAVLAKQIGFRGRFSCYQFVGSVFLGQPHSLSKSPEASEVLISYGNDLESIAETEAPEQNERSDRLNQGIRADARLDCAADSFLNLDPQDLAEDSPEPLFSASSQVFRLQRRDLSWNEVLPPFEDDIEHAFLPSPSQQLADDDPRATVIHLAKSGDEQGLLQLVRRESSLNFAYCDQNSRTALSWAAGQGYPRIVHLLLETVRFHSLPQSVLTKPRYKDHALPPVNLEALQFRRYCNRMDEDGRTPLAWAAADGQLETVKELLRYPDVVVDARDRFRWTPLWYATNNTRVDVMRYLIGAGADKDARELHGKTMVEMVAIYGTVAAMKVLLCPPVVWNSMGLAMLVASHRGKLHMIRLLMEAGAPIDERDEEGSSPIRWAVMQGHDQIVGLLLGTGQIDLKAKVKPLRGIFRDRKESGDSLLCLAIRDRNPVLNDPHDSTRNVEGYLPIINILMDSGQMDLQPALHLAASVGDIIVVNLLLQTSQVDVNARDSAYNDASPIYYAALRGHTSVVKRLLQIDAINIDIPGVVGRTGKYTSRRGENQKETPLQAAIEGGHGEVVRLLREHTKKRNPNPLSKWF